MNERQKRVWSRIQIEKARPKEERDNKLLRKLAKAMWKLAGEGLDWSETVDSKGNENPFRAHRHGARQYRWARGHGNDMNE